MRNEIRYFGSCWCFLLVLIGGACSTIEEDDQKYADLTKVKFQLDSIRSDGLRGQQDGQTTVAYEFCIPADEALFAEIKSIDPSVRFHKGSRGRIGCGENQILCIGETSQLNWKDNLLNLTKLPYIKEIRECFYE